MSSQTTEKPCWMLTVFYKDAPATILHQGTLVDYLKEEDANPILFAQKISQEEYEANQDLEVYP